MDGWTPSGGIFDLPRLERRITELNEAVGAPDFWSKPSTAQAATRELARLKREVEGFRKVVGMVEDLETVLELAGEDEAAGAELVAESVPRMEEAESRVRELELESFLSGEADVRNAIVVIHPGAGGTESQDWAQILLRMYLRWAERKGFATEILDQMPGEEAGIKNATFSVSGDYAFGFLKGENGVHRLVRISPYDQAARRHTSFSSVFVYPEIEEDDIEIKIEDKDLRIDVFRSSGAGGQHVNVTDSAVRLTHLPTGIVISCQNERSQIKNRSTAMKVLRARLYEMKVREREAEHAKLHEGKKEIAWGSQIRSYVLAPYQMVKDHRTGYEVGNASSVLDGELDGFIEAFLMGKRQE